MDINIGHFIYTIIRAVMNLGQKLYDMFTYQVDISFVSKLLGFFKADIALPETISLSYILGGMSAVVLLGLIVYNVFKL